MAIHNAGAAIIAKLADLATADQRSPLFGVRTERFSPR
jgi:xanthine dehydrogenase YagR molybdenum-binding subunit